MSSSGDDSDSDCELGKREFWDGTYERELQILEQTGDEGEVWFGEDVMRTMVDWLHGLLSKQTAHYAKSSILDVGTGNALLPLQLWQLGYRNLTASDYSAHSILLAEHVLRKHSVTQIKLVEDDLLHTSLTNRFDVITDKGTLDAVGLMQDAVVNRALYQRSVWSLLDTDGLLVITSCNSTKEELCEEFCHSRQDSQALAATSNGTQQHDNPRHQKLFQYVDHVRSYPRFKFAGVEGTKVCTVAFKKLM